MGQTRVTRVCTKKSPAQRGRVCRGWIASGCYPARGIAVELLQNRTNRDPVVTVVGGRKIGRTIPEIQVVGFAGFARAERRWPVAAVLTAIVEARATHVASSGEENSVCTVAEEGACHSIITCTPINTLVHIGTCACRVCGCVV